MKLREVQLLLSGETIPGDMVVNETASEYIHRKLKEIDKYAMAWEKMAARNLEGNDGIVSAEKKILEYKARIRALEARAVKPPESRDADYISAANPVNISALTR